MATKSISVLISAIDKATAPIRKIQQALDGFKKVEGIRRISAALQTVQSNFQNVTREAGLFAARMGALSVAGVGLFAAFIKPASAMENLRFRLKQLYGDKNRAAEIFKYIQNFAIKSPYGIEAITNGLLMFKGQGFDNLKQFSNIMNYLAVYVPDQFKASNAIIQMSQAWGKAKLQMADIRPMIEAGVPVWELLSQVTGKTTEQLQDMSTKGTITRKVMMQMFSLMGKKSNGAGGEIFKLWSTKISNLQDLWMKFADNVMNIKLGNTTVFDTIKADLDKLSTFLDKGLSGDAGKQVAQTLMDIYTTAKELSIALFPLIKELAVLTKVFVQLAGGPANAIKMLIALMAVPLITSILVFITSIGTLATTIAGWSITMEIAWAALGAWVSILTLLSSPIGWIIGAITILAGLGALIYANWNAVSTWFVAMWQKWGGLIRTMFPAIGLFVDLIDLIGQNWHKVEGTASLAIDAMMSKLQELKKWLEPILQIMQNIGLAVSNWATNLPNQNLLTGRANFAMQNLSPLRPSVAMAPAVPMSPLNRAAYAAAKPKKDKLELGLKVDVVNRSVQLTNAKSRGDSDLSYFYDMGFTQ